MIDLKVILEKADHLVESDLKTCSIKEQEKLIIIRKTLFYIYKALELEENKLNNI